RNRGVRQLMLDVVHLRLHVEQRLKRAAGLLEHRAPAMREAVLRQVADREIRRLGDDARVGFLEVGQHLEQGGLAGAVRSAQSDTITVPDLPGDAIEERAIAEGLGEFAELNHAADAPNARAAASSTWVSRSGLVREPAGGLDVIVVLG